VVINAVADDTRLSLFRTYTVQGHLRSSISVSVESALCNFLLVINSDFLDYLLQFSRYRHI